MTEKTITIGSKEYYTYATVSDANDYFAAVYGSEWSSVSQTDKPLLLVTATNLIDKRNYQGVKKDETQHLDFPRIIADELTDDDLVMQTCCEVAMSLYINGGGSSINGVNIKNIQSFSVGDTSATFKKGATVETEQDAIIDDYLSDYLMGGVQVIL